MDFLKSQFDRIQQQLAGLSPSQKMLSAALVIIMAMALWSWGNYAAKPEYEVLLDQPLSQEDVGRIDLQLTSAGIEHKVGNDSRVMVPSDKRLQAIANLGYSNLLPKNTSSGFDEMVKQLTPWDAQSRQDAYFNHAKELQLQQVLNLFENVTSATVMLDANTRRRIGDDVKPTASVSLKLKTGVNGNQQLARTCAQFVAGAQAGLAVSQVRVTINGKYFPVHEESEGNGGLDGNTILETQQAAEVRLTEKLRDAFSYIDGVRASVTVQVENSLVNTETVTVDKDKSYTGEEQITNKTREETTSSPASGEAGVVPNAGLSVAAAPVAGPQQSSTETEETVKNMLIPATTKTQIHTAPGQVKAASATVQIPRSYFVKVAQSKSGDPSKEPSSPEVEKTIEAMLPSFTKLAMNTSGVKGDSVTVATFVDFDLPAPAEAKLAPTSTVTMLLSGHVKEIGLGLLAAFSLFMMSMIVRKGTPASVVPAISIKPAQAAATPLVNNSESFIGEVSETSPTLDGMELDEDSIKTQQMLSQVTSLVGENPDSAAQLIKRWMNQR